jgi:death-on-curing protein
VKEPNWVSEIEVTALHDEALLEYGGSPGIRDRRLLESALARPRQVFAYTASANIVELAAVYTAGIVRNHPFVDGNKRAAYSAAIAFLILNGYRIVTTHGMKDAVVNLAEGSLTEAAFATFLGSAVEAL